MFYIVYQTTNNINGKTYIGCHRTYNINDGYLGSGKLLALAVKKYGKESFKREIISYHNSVEEMYKAETAIVNEDFIKLPTNYNMREGGWGGRASREVYDKISSTLKGVTKSKETRKKMSMSQTGKKLSAETREKISKASANRLPITDETRHKLSTEAKTAKNKSAGTVWVTNGTKNKRISKETVIPKDWYKGRS